MRRLLGPLTTTVLIVGLLGSCSTDPPTITSGVCLARETAGGEKPVPDLTSVVPCTTQHRYEVYDVIELSGAKATASDAQQRCATSLLRVTGYDTLKVNGKDAADVGLAPGLRGIQAPIYVVMPEQPWKTDSREVACTARMTVPAQAARNDLQLLSLAKTSEYPVALRPCRAYDSARRAIDDVACTKRHASELLFFFEADRALGKRFATSIARNPTVAAFDRLDTACTKALPYLLGKGFDKRLRGFGSVAQRWTEDSKSVRCEVGPRAFRTTDLPPGSLVATHGRKVKLLRVP